MSLEKRFTILPKKINKIKFFLQEQDMRNYSFPQIGNNSQTNQNTIFNSVNNTYIYMYLGTSLVVQCPRAEDIGPIPGPGRSHMTQSN